MIHQQHSSDCQRALSSGLPDRSLPGEKTHASVAWLTVLVAIAEREHATYIPDRYTTTTTISKQHRHTPHTQVFPVSRGRDFALLSKTDYCSTAVSYMFGVRSTLAVRGGTLYYMLCCCTYRRTTEPCPLQMQYTAAVHSVRLLYGSTAVPLYTRQPSIYTADRTLVGLDLSPAASYLCGYIYIYMFAYIRYTLTRRL